MNEATGESPAVARHSGGAPQEAPGPGLFRSARLLLAWGRNRIAPIERLAREYGGVFCLRIPGLRFYFINDPDLVEEILGKRQRQFGKDRLFIAFVRLILGNGLLTNEGPGHQRQRRLIQPAFHRDRINGYGQVMADCAVAAGERWTDGARINMHFEMSQLTLDIVGKTLFNSDVRDDAAKVAHAIETIIQRSDIFLLPFFPRLLQLPLPWNRSFHGAVRDLDEVLYRIIEEHRAQEDDAGDLLSMLLAARYEDDGTGMSDEQIRDEALTLFTAGHETTAVALSWTWYLLAKHPEIAAKLHEEVDRVLQGRAPTPEDFRDLPYTYRVFQESLRLYPPTLMVGREAREDLELGGFRVPDRSLVILTPYVVHRDPALYEDPERFDPDRWLPEAVARRHRFAYFPFGQGQRRCIGEAFAWMEAVMILAALAQNWSPQLAQGEDIVLNPRLTMRPAHGDIPMVLRRR